MLLAGPLLNRWILMPLVPDVDRLTLDEQLYFQRGRCARDEITARDFASLNCVNMPTDFRAVSHVRLEFNVGISHLTKAIETLKTLISGATSEVAEELQDLSLRLQALKSLYKTVVNFFCFTYSLTARGRDDVDFIFRDHFNLGSGINRGSWELRAFARAEMDNALELADLIEASPKPLIACTDNPDDEDGVHFGPDLVDQLRKKAKIMMKYWPLYNQLYPPVPLIKKLRIPALEQAGDIDEPKEL